MYHLWLLNIRGAIMDKYVRINKIEYDEKVLKEFFENTIDQMYKANKMIDEERKTFFLYCSNEDIKKSVENIIKELNLPHEFIINVTSYIMETDIYMMCFPKIDKPIKFITTGGPNYDLL